MSVSSSSYFRRGILLTVILALVAYAADASATFSVIALERETGRMGAASASCVPLETLERVYAAAPGFGAVLTQSYLLDGDIAQQEALSQLAAGTDAPGVLAALVDPMFDADFGLRQYVVLDVSGGVATFTGSAANDFAGHQQHEGVDYVIAVAGNFITGPEVLDAAIDGFNVDGACDLEARLHAAIAAVDAAGLGDARCVVDGRAAQSAWLTSGEIDIRVDAGDNDDPVAEVARRFAAWRDTHSCPAPVEDPRDPPDERTASADGCAVGGAGDTPWLILALLALPLFTRGRFRASGSLDGCGGRSTSGRAR